MPISRPSEPAWQWMTLTGTAQRQLMQRTNTEHYRTCFNVHARCHCFCPYNKGGFALYILPVGSRVQPSLLCLTLSHVPRVQILCAVVNKS